MSINLLIELYKKEDYKEEYLHYVNKYTDEKLVSILYILY